MVNYPQLALPQSHTLPLGVVVLDPYHLEAALFSSIVFVAYKFSTNWLTTL